MPMTTEAYERRLELALLVQKAARSESYLALLSNYMVSLLQVSLCATISTRIAP